MVCFYELLLLLHTVEKLLRPQIRSLNAFPGKALSKDLLAGLRPGF